LFFTFFRTIKKIIFIALKYKLPNLINPPDKNIYKKTLTEKAKKMSSIYQQPKALGTRVPLPNKTRIPDQTSQRLGHFTSNTSHHFHNNIGPRNGEFISHQGIHANRYGPSTNVRATATHMSSMYTDFNYQRTSPKKPF
jgi:hypothetical protein